MSKVRHVLGISGGKDSAALAIYIKTKYPELDLEFYSSDTGKELEETYQLVKNIETHLGIKIVVLKAAENSSEDSFDHFLQMYGGFLPSSTSRWCTKKLKLDPFEKYVGDDLVVSYVGIRGDENREGYISTKSNIQSIFPFRKNIWSEDVVNKVLSNQNIDLIESYAKDIDFGRYQNQALDILIRRITPSFTRNQKLEALLDTSVKGFNHLVFQYLKTTEYPLAKEVSFPLIDNEDVLVKDDIFRILKESGVGVPAYYNEIEFEVNGKKGKYARSRSGCFFCFYQQKIEWVWLYEQHPELYKKAMEYEKDGFTWAQGESLEDIIKPKRIEQIKEEYIKRTQRIAKNAKSSFLIDILDDEEEGCAACFV